MSRPFKIKPTFQDLQNPIHPSILETAEAILESMISQFLNQESFPLSNPHEISSFLRRFSKQLPLFSCSPPGKAPCSLTFNYLYQANYTNGTERYVVDLLNRWLVPGTHLKMISHTALNFYFEIDSTRPFHLCQETIAIEDPNDLKSVRHNIETLRHLRQKIPLELDRKAESILHPVFMPRNEEELFRNIVELSRQLKYTRDLPQVILHYEKQTHLELSFAVVAVRVLTPKTLSIRQLLQPLSLSIKLDVEDVRIVGILRQKYQKEAVILRVTLDKTPFFRQDYSVDLLRARQQIVFELTQIFGDFRDYNGGMILKQDEALDQLRRSMGALNKDQEFMLENYFRSLKPGIMQTVHDPLILKQHFLMLMTLIESPLLEEPYIKKTIREEKFSLCFIRATTPEIRNEIFDALSDLKILSHELTSSFLQVQDKSMIGFILRFDRPQRADQFESAIDSARQKWSANKQQFVVAHY